ncbi:dihydroxyacetone phosphate acyltransferase [Episyrphus balteatus]|uniref:dihydroxyacetone phosphate acyltransferase n=1 Tax=Episyrphus balteatus TaxID=286459 RepID=UPI0024860DE9|nr:dihydroxyacetone phosphate acyltransferase [Episyrphus balteatus]
MTTSKPLNKPDDTTSWCYMNDFQNMVEKGKEPDMTKVYNPKVAQEFEKYLNPTTLKRHVVRSEKMQKIIDIYAKAEKRTHADVERQVRDILDEIGLERSVVILRWCGIAITAIAKRITSGIFVNSKNLNRVRDGLGKNPVLYLPSHRSYLDFILMSYICFHYNIEIPGIAAGMDFHAMFGMGKMLRKTGAFFMRRSFSGDELYWDVFREYMYALVASYHIGAEFFIEGTRSRNFKALVPKVGLLSMALMPFFTGEVSDITIIPVSVSYERVLEEQLFVYELLGVPKPKESTKGFFKALKILDERFGRMYMDVGDPISVKEFFGPATDRIRRASIASHLQKLNKDEVLMIKKLANEVVYQQQKRIVITTFNMIAVLYTYSLNCQRPLNIDELSNEVLLLKTLFEKLGAHVATNSNSIKPEIIKTVEIHSNVVTFEKANLKFTPSTGVDMRTIEVKKLKGHMLTQNTMTIAVPALHIQLYINPCMFWLAKPSFVVLAAMKLNAKGYRNILPADQLEENLNELCKIFNQEFILDSTINENSISHILDVLRSFGIFNGMEFLANDVSKLLLSTIAPFLCVYYQLALAITELPLEEFTAKDVILQTQKRVEVLLTAKSHQYVHPYCLALDNLNIAIQSFVQGGCLKKTKDATTFRTIPENLQHLKSLLLNYCELLPFTKLYQDTLERLPSKL